MQKPKNRIAAIAIAIFLMLSMSASMMLIPTTSAHTPAWNLTTFAYIQAFPNPIGVGQATYIYVWMDKVFDSAAFVNDYRFHNYKVTITAPDGTTETKTWDVVQDTTSSQGFSFTPDQVGDYNFNFTFPGQAVNTYSHSLTSLAVNDTYLPSTASMTLTVQQAPISNLPDSYPLPTQYWTRPIYGENPYWWSISSDWLGTGSPQLTTHMRYLSDGVGSQTAHIMWTKPLQTGGVVGGNNFAIQGNTYFEGSAYISRYRNPIIVAGKLYYTEPLGFSSASGGPTDCVDLRTGKLIWSRTDVPSLSFAIVYDTEQANQHGVMPPVLCTANFARCFDADTGNALYNFTGVPTGTTVLGPQGEFLKYVVTNCGTAANPDWYLSEWNSSKIFFAGGLTPTQSGNYIVNGSNCYDWNVSIPWLNVMGNQTETTVKYTDGSTAIVKGYSATGTNPNAANPSTQLYSFYGDCIICRNGTLPGIGSSSSAIASSWSTYTYFAVNINATKGALGSVRWWNTLQPPAGNVTVLGGNADPTVGVFTETYKETMQWVGYSMATGAKLWGPTKSQTDLDYYGYFFPGISGVPAYGKLYSSGMAGIVYCYDMTTGDLLWTYGNGGSGNSTNSAFQVPGPYPTFIYAVCNGIVYTMTTEHTVETPIYKGAETRAINATDGSEIWTLSNYNGGGTSSCAVADGFATFFNGYDDQIYVVGRGSSATTVTAPNTGLSLGTSVVIRGTVTDISSGTTQTEQAADFPNGVACASDASMTDWMGYVYQQKPLPTNFTGVPVSVDVLDSNGNYRNIGTATTDATGMYSLSWKPDITGNFTVIATFHGTNGYWPSYSETSFVVDQAAPTASPYPVVNLPPTETYFAISTVAIIIAIAIATVLILRKRP